MHGPGQSAVQNPSASLAIKSDTRIHQEKTCLHGAADLPMRLAPAGRALLSSLRSRLTPSRPRTILDHRVLSQRLTPLFDDLAGQANIKLIRLKGAPYPSIGQQDRSRWFGSMLSTLRVQVMNAYAELESNMDVVVRTYSGKGSKELFSFLEEHKADVEKLMRTVKGFESYTLARSSESEGGLSMTVCQDKAGTEESVRLAKEWISKNAADISVDAPKVSVGSIIIHATKS